MIKFLSVCALALLAPVLLADSIGYMVNKNLQQENNVEITAWSWKQIDYTATVEKSDGKGDIKVEKVKKSVARKDVVTLSRSSEGGSMSETLFRALSDLGNDPQAAVEALDEEARSGTPLNKEEAKFRIASYFAANANKQSAKFAGDKLREYLTAFKDGYFIGEAYTLLGRMQILGRDTEGARTTYKEMVRLGPPFDAKANQARGELELSLGKYDDALGAFRDAAKNAGADKALKAKADAYASWALLANKKVDEARGIAEPITKDESIDDANSVDDEAALAIAYRVLGDCLLESQTFERAYDAHMLSAYYAWWVGGTTEGYSLAQSYFAAKKLESTDEKFKARAEKLRTALEAGYPGELKRVNDKLKG
jgi:tetratricopeptide (TPR) repeat protein